ncbi:hypothetical protein ACFVHB_20275 [Kitasatospora sp. NPDC127111]|uniref:hypothetical protein n=1 Tax=Kitasatospora sp. NPDC127111 TaxID=3345363 RepID=UPI00363D13D4
MGTATPLTYAVELIQPSNDKIAHWKAPIGINDRLPTLIGDCPACNHGCEIPVADQVVQGGTPESGTTQEPPQKIVWQVICNCRSIHQQPSGVKAGCGRYWLCALTKQDGSYKVAVEEDLTLLPAASALNDALATEDVRVQKAAEKWLGAVTAIYGLFSLAGIATAKDALAGMEWWGKLAVGVALLAGLATAATALVFGYRAAYGWPRLVRVNGVNLREWHKSRRNYAEKAADDLNKALTFAFISLAAIAAVMLLVWFLPR